MRTRNKREEREEREKLPFITLNNSKLFVSAQPIRELEISGGNSGFYGPLF